jgi:hypothetical protein
MERQIYIDYLRYKANPNSGWADRVHKDQLATMEETHNRLYRGNQNYHNLFSSYKEGLLRLSVLANPHAKNLLSASSGLPFLKQNFIFAAYALCSMPEIIRSNIAELQMSSMAIKAIERHIL